MPGASRRYGRLQVCVTMKASALEGNEALLNLRPCERDSIAFTPRSGVQLRTSVMLYCVLWAFLTWLSITWAAPRSWHDEADHRWSELAIEARGRTGFALLTSDATGVAFTNTLSELQGATNRVLWNGSGAAAGDFDGDGLIDFFLCRLNGANALYRNLGGWLFRDVTVESGLARPSQFDRGAVFADLSGDGRLDLLIGTTGGGIRCFLNDGNGRFRDVSRAVGTLSKFGVSTLALADVNGDGFLDIYSCNYRAQDIKDLGRVELTMKDGQTIVPPALTNWVFIQDGQLLQYGEPDVLYLNDGKGRFIPVSWTDGTFRDEDNRPLQSAPLDWGLTAAFRDVNGDSYPDLYVCNDYWTPDRFWLGDGKGGFRAIHRLALRQISGSSMGVDFADLDRDGLTDFFVVEMLSRDPRLRKRQLAPTKLDPPRIGEIDNRPQTLRNTLFRNRGDGTFAELAHFAGLAASDWSWSPVFLDVDLDGYEDVLITAGHVHDMLDADAREAIRTRGATQGRDNRVANDRLFPRLEMPIVAFRNLGNWRFEEMTESWGTGARGVHHALATADFDGDGDLDLIVNNLGSAASLYRNDSSAPRVAVRLRGLHPNVQGIGARVALLGGPVPAQMHEVISGGRYMAGSDPQIVFAVGAATNKMAIEVAWRSGRWSVVRDISPNRLYEIREPATAAPSVKPPKNEPPPALFRDISATLGHVHRDTEFDDYARQPLLPRKLSQFGPAVAWFDVNEDGREDLIVGVGKGGHLAVFHNDGGGRFSPRPSVSTSAAQRDQTAIVGWKTPAGEPALLIGSSNYDDGRAEPASVLLHDLKAQTASDAVPGSNSSTGPIALADIDGDGVCELFVGGRSIPGTYPAAASSALFRCDGARWTRDEKADPLLSKIGLASGAVWTDLTGDGFAELVVSCEWGPLRVFRNHAGILQAWDVPITLPAPPSRQKARASAATNEQTASLSSLCGWWQGVSAGDFDGDGRMDLVAGNWGLNSEYRASPEEPLRLYFGEFNGQPGPGLIETEWDSRARVLAPRRRLEDLSRALPWLGARFTTHRAFSEASISAALDENASRADYVEATCLATAVFLNRNDRFHVVPLPDEAQLAPAFGVNVADANGDGHEDIFLAQNVFANRVEVSRQDAGRGLWLLGDGAGSFRPLSARESGVAVDGEGRGSAVADFDEDGRVDLVVGQHGAATKLFENVNAKQGLRVRLEGPPGNPNGFGTVLRTLCGNQIGPAREVHGGSGHWSQDGAIQVLGFAQRPDHIWVRWPGGRTNIIEAPLGLSTLTVPHYRSADR